MLYDFFVCLGTESRLWGRRGCNVGGRCPNIGAFFRDCGGLRLCPGGDPGFGDCLELIDSVEQLKRKRLHHNDKGSILSMLAHMKSLSLLTVSLTWFESLNSPSTVRAVLSMADSCSSSR